MSDPDHGNQPTPEDTHRVQLDRITPNPIDATLTERRHADLTAMEATEHALLNAGIDPSDPWAVERGAVGDPPSPVDAEVHSPANQAAEDAEPSGQMPAPTVTIPEFDPDARGNGYVYLRLADHLEARIKAHDLRPGSQLPAERTLAMQYGVSIGTVRRVAAELRSRDLIVTLPAKGTYVRR
jgi:GntR family transcriptional regulator